MKTLCALTSVLLCACILLSACGKNNTKDNTDYVAPDKFTFEQKAETGSFNAKLYTVSGKELKSSTAKIELFGELSAIDALMEALFSQTSLSQGIASEIRFTGALLSYDVCVVSLEGKMHENINDWFLLELVITNTLHDFCGAETVTFLLNGSAPEYNGIPLGASLVSEYPPDEYITHRKEEHDMDTQEKGQISGNTVHFIPIHGENYMKAQVKADKIFSYGDSLKNRIETLLHQHDKELTRSHNKSESPLLESCYSHTLRKTKELTSGKVYINLRKTTACSIDSKVFADCVAFTLISNIPGIQEVSITIDESVYTCSYPNCTLSLGTDFTAFYPMRDESTLESVEIVVPSEKRHDAKTILDNLLLSKNTRGTLFPDYLYSQITVIGLSDGVLAVSFPDNVRDRVMENFIESDAHYKDSNMRERLFIYTIVNSLTQLPDVKRVLFMNSSESACDKLINIYLGVPLYRNPGLEAD
ncbi:MAG: GerMN domain-containing protein [Clostridia bacterium]|nr:GerMN domain-containing protein [Clostridia bacterium]